MTDTITAPQQQDSTSTGENEWVHWVPNDAVLPCRAACGKWLDENWVHPPDGNHHNLVNCPMCEAVMAQGPPR